ncbi:NADH dehydrogenase [ubiquinone] 1 beta subcomplex subunit 11, mitochondrial [Phalacrocorax aristotelis]|uniref:NADH dehydrogenase [ubiquinone] 1 beta subcomplex subunit 11, mitochondrial n=1 Tax=Phalacrocorax aristotelis TaxID=126867 RepID=UPI003F4C2A83
MAALGRALRALRARAGALRAGALRAGTRDRSAGTPGAVALPRVPLGAELHEEEPMAVAQRKNPDWHGFSADPAADLANMRAVFIAGISIAIVLGTVFLHYLPDYGLQQWARREAELQIRERESRGLPLLDPNYYDPARLALPPPE